MSNLYPSGRAQPRHDTLRDLRRAWLHRIGFYRIHLSRSRETAILRAWLAPASPQTLTLDLGCGDGYWTAAVLGDARPGIGLDIDGDALDRARRFQGRPGLHFAQGSAMTLPFADATFAQAVCVCALQNFPAPQAALQELGRVTAPGGRLVLSVDSLLAPPWVTPEYRQYHAARFATGRAYDLDILRADLRQAGFVVEAHRWLLRSRFAGWWAMEQERRGWTVNYWFPLSLAATRLADAVTDEDRPGAILAVCARRS
jgi:SAM-dependent methyltransferase